jgi:hypothetical protein
MSISTKNIPSLWIFLAFFATSFVVSFDAFAADTSSCFDERGYWKGVCTTDAAPNCSDHGSTWVEDPACASLCSGRKFCVSKPSAQQTVCGPSNNGYCTTTQPCDRSGYKPLPGGSACPAAAGGSQICCVPEEGAGTGAAQKCDTSKGFVDRGGICLPENSGLSGATVYEILFSVIRWLIGIFGFVAILAFLVSGFQYLLAFGDEKQIETAKTNMKWSVVGIAVALSGFIIIRAVDMALRGSAFF